MDRKYKLPTAAGVVTVSVLDLADSIKRLRYNLAAISRGAPLSPMVIEQYIYLAERNPDPMRRERYLEGLEDDPRATIIEIVTEAIANVRSRRDAILNGEHDEHGA